MRVQVPHPIPYQGSKRHLAPFIRRYFPQQLDRLIEPFAGSAALSLSAAFFGQAKRFLLNDINQPLMDLWHEIIHNPSRTASNYRTLWSSQLQNPRQFYDDVRNRFNATRNPEYLLYLLARCVKASIRYNSYGEFNQSPDNRRLGVRPETMEFHIAGASRLLRGRTDMTATDYRDILAQAQRSDLVYMDPPYQGVSSNRDARYIGGIILPEFIEALKDLNDRDISFIISYDGSSGGKSYGSPLPSSLNLIRLELHAGTSSQATLLGRRAATIESLYLSPALANRLDDRTFERLPQPKEAIQLALGTV